jgi:dihydroorotate dehydrogenase (fumarate)
MIDLTTDYMGLTLRNPLVCSSSPLCESLGELCRMEDAGAGAVVLPSLFEEQVAAEVPAGTPDMTGYNLGPDGYLDHVRRAKERLRIPVIGSLNGSTPGGWTRYARLVEQAGADALELNLYWLSTDPALRGHEVERLYADLVAEVKLAVRVPVAVKVGPFLTAPAAFARALAEAGADALVLFNRFYQPDFDLDRMAVVPRLAPSTPGELLLRLHWTAILAGRVRAQLAVTGGVHSHLDVLKVILAGGQVAMMTSALLVNGTDHLTTVLAGLAAWLTGRGHTDLRLRGSMSLRRVDDPAAYERASYLNVLRQGAMDGPTA